MQRASYRRNFTPAQPDSPATSLRDFVSGAYTVVITAENDVLRDEGKAHAAHLEAAGVPVTLRRYAGMTHGFIRLHDMVDTAADAVRDLAADIRRLCGAPITAFAKREQRMEETR